MDATLPVSCTNPPGLSEREQSALRALAGVMIPPSAQYGVPGADDAAIFAEIVAAAAGEGGRARDALARLDDGAAGGYAQLDAARRVAVAEAFGRAMPQSAALLFSLVARCYYRDERVMRALEMEPRAPFPRGFDLEPSELALLEPVIARAKVYRDAY